MGQSFIAVVLLKAIVYNIVNLYADEAQLYLCVGLFYKWTAQNIL